MATFKREPAPQEFEWTIQWKNWLSRQFTNLINFFDAPEFPSVTTDTLIVEGDGLIEGALQIEEDLSADDAAFAGEVTIGEDLAVGGMIDGENSPNHIGPITASGTIPPITDIPSWVRRISVIFSAVSVSGTDDILIQLGGETSGYTSGVALIVSGGNPGITTSTTGFIILSSAGTDALYGSYVFTLVDPITNLWSAEMRFERTGALRIQVGAGQKALSSILTQLQVVTSGVNTFDSGTITVRYEY